jgi:dTDP-4-amino-4,6-dideoxygalactose transaminase
LCIDPEKIETAITSRTKAILAVHVFGRPCDVERIDDIAKKHNLKVIYDAAHALGVNYKGKSLLDYGDISTCSFHSTKLFNTIEGGAIVTKDKALQKKIDLIKRFGHYGDDHKTLGINAKTSEFNAAMGLCNLSYLEDIISSRKEASESYDRHLKGVFMSRLSLRDTKYNYSYYPVIFDDEDSLLKVKLKLEQDNIFPRRYFYPSLNTLPYIKTYQSCPISENISKRILCLPLYYGLTEEEIIRICDIIKS